MLARRVLSPVDSARKCTPTPRLHLAAYVSATEGIFKILDMQICRYAGMLSDCAHVCLQDVEVGVVTVLQQARLLQLHRRRHRRRQLLGRDLAGEQGPC